MLSNQVLKEANYVHRGADGEYMEGLGQCSFSPCDHSKIIKDDRTGEEYRYCMKLQMPVDSYDSCKYHSEEQWMGLMGQMANLLQEENKVKERASKKQAPSKSKKNYALPIFIILCIAILLYILMK